MWQLHGERMTEIDNTTIAPLENKPKRGLTGNALKLIAIIAMTIDHVTWVIFPGFSHHPIAIVLHVLGRITCPIMCYFVAEGFFYTHDVNKYTARLFIFAAISHVPYMLRSQAFVNYGFLALVPFATGNGFWGHVLDQTSVIWSLAIGLVMLRVNTSQKLKDWQKILLILLLCVPAFPSDWSCIASLVIATIGTYRGKPLKQILWSMFYVAIYALVYILAMDVVYGLVQFGVILSVPLIALYNGQRGINPKVNKFMKWAFYIYYPLHLLVIGIVIIVTGQYAA